MLSPVKMAKIIRCIQFLSAEWRQAAQRPRQWARFIICSLMASLHTPLISKCTVLLFINAVYISICSILIIIHAVLFPIYSVLICITRFSILHTWPSFLYISFLYSRPAFLTWAVSGKVSDSLQMVEAFPLALLVNAGPDPICRWPAADSLPVVAVSPVYSYIRYQILVSSTSSDMHNHMSISAPSGINGISIPVIRDRGMSDRPGLGQETSSRGRRNTSRSIRLMFAQNLNHGYSYTPANVYIQSLGSLQTDF